MPFFFATAEEVELFRDKLPFCICPLCKRMGFMIRHGFQRWVDGPKKSGIRGWRISCKGCDPKTGQNRTWSVRLGDTLLRRWFSAQQLWDFLQLLRNGRSIKKNWEEACLKGFSASLDTAYKLLRRLALCQTVLRTQLCVRGPPPSEETGVPLFHVLAHLKEVFGNLAPITSYQLSFQRNFLAVT